MRANRRHCRQYHCRRGRLRQWCGRQGEGQNHRLGNPPGRVMRKLLVCALIVIAAVATIATAAVLRAGNEKEQLADQALAVGVTTSTLSEKEMKSALGDDAFTVTSQFGRLTATPAKVDPAVCDGISGIVSPSTFKGVDWAAMRGSMGTSPRGQQFHFGSQGLIALTTPEVARRYLENSAQSWQQCNGHPYADGS